MINDPKHLNDSVDKYIYKYKRRYLLAPQMKQHVKPLFCHALI